MSKGVKRLTKAIEDLTDAVDELTDAIEKLVFEDRKAQAVETTKWLSSGGQIRPWWEYPQPIYRFDLDKRELK